MEGSESHIWKQQGNHFPDHTFHWDWGWGVFKDMGTILRPLIWGAGEQVRLARPKADVMPGREGVLEIISKVHTLAHSMVLTVKLLNPGQLPALCATLQSTGCQRCQFSVGLTGVLCALTLIHSPPSLLCSRPFLV